MNILVSVCIPVYNGEKYLAQCLHSITKQTYKNIEILVVDDGSVDGSVKLVREMMALDSRISLSINKTNLGLVKNWRRCIELAKGSWVKFMFQDDTMEHNCVEEMLFTSLENKVQICVCGRNFLIENNTSDNVINYFTNHVIELNKIFTSIKKFNPKEIARIASDKLFTNFLGEPITLLFHKDVINKVGTYNKDLVQLVDYEFALRACLNNSSVSIPKKLVTFRTHPDSSTNKKYSSNIKIVKGEFIEPLIMFHEYLFKKTFKLLRKEHGVFKLLKNAVVFYNLNSKLYILPDKIKKDIFNRYKGLHIIRTISVLLTLKNSFKNRPVNVSISHHS